MNCLLPPAVQRSMRLSFPLTNPSPPHREPVDDAPHVLVQLQRAEGGEGVLAQRGLDPLAQELSDAQKQAPRVRGSEHAVTRQRPQHLLQRAQEARPHAATWHGVRRRTRHGRASPKRAATVNSAGQTPKTCAHWRRVALPPWDFSTSLHSLVASTKVNQSSSLSLSHIHTHTPLSPPLFFCFARLTGRPSRWDRASRARSSRRRRS